jgi:hypothetical protein
MILRVIAVVVLLFLTHIFFAPLGYWAVHEACGREAGLKIVKTDNVDSYWHDGYMTNGETWTIDCELCISQVARGEFEYVDFERPDTIRRRPSGLVRFQLADAEGANCIVPIGRAELPVGQCVVASTITRDSASRYQYRYEQATEKGLLGVAIRAFRQSVYDTTTKKNIATSVHFDYATPAERSGNFARGYHCERPSLPIDSNKFVLRVLRVAPGTESGTAGANP